MRHVITRSASQGLCMDAGAAMLESACHQQCVASAHRQRAGCTRRCGSVAPSAACSTRRARSSADFGRSVPWLTQQPHKRERRAAVVLAAAAPLTAERTTSRSRFWRWRGTDVHYETAGTTGPAVLLLPGFGVGSFHFAAQLEELSQHHGVYALDFLGQGKSWPEDATGLQLSVDLWREQVVAFVEQVVLPADPDGQPPFLAGNSLGGFVATYVAALHPDLVRGLILLNATPFWSNAPNPETEPAAAARMPWDGTLPAPWYLRLLVGLWWNTLRLPSTIRSLLGLVYADRSTLTDTLVEDILQPTQRVQAGDVFVSIFLSPKAPLSFNDMLDRCSCPMMLCYGAEDPWVVPLWGQRLKRRVPTAAYYEMSPAGHCPHHEQPAAVNTIMASWLASQISGTPELLPNDGDVLDFSLDGAGKALRITRTDGSPRNPFEIADAAAAAQSADGRTKSQAGAQTLLKRMSGRR